MAPSRRALVAVVSFVVAGVALLAASTRLDRTSAPGTAPAAARRPPGPRPAAPIAAPVEDAGRVRAKLSARLRWCGGDDDVPPGRADPRLGPGGAERERLTEELRDLAEPRERVRRIAAWLDWRILIDDRDDLAVLVDDLAGAEPDVRQGRRLRAVARSLRTTRDELWRALVSDATPPVGLERAGC